MSLSTALETDNADLNLTSYATALSSTGETGARYVIFDVQMGDGTKNLDGTGGVFGFRFTVGSQVAYVYHELEAVTRAKLTVGPWRVPASTAYTLEILSPNSADSDVDVTVIADDWHPGMPESTAESRFDNLDGDNIALSARIPAALVSGRMDSTVDGTGMEAGAVSAVQSGLATASAVSTAQTDLTTLIGRLTAARALLLDNIDVALTALESNIRGADSDTLKTLSDQLDAIGTIGGTGANTVTLTMLESDSDPVADADVWITNDAAGNNVVAGTSQTDSNGQVSFLLDNGNTYYLWAQKDGWDGHMGTAFVAVAD